MSSIKYRPEIDGLRTVAVLPVILFHAEFGIFRGGFVGVDIFFVISGFLITTILINEMDAGRYSILNFYERRARRILPALFFVIIACLPFAWMWLMPADMLDFAQSILAVLTFSSNILFWQESDYFGAASELKPLLHTWSLAVEEQYYILFPVYLALAWRFGKRFVAVSLLVIALASLALSHWAAFNMHVANFYLLPTRAWELLVGSLGAFWLQDPKRLDRLSRPLRQGLSLAGLVLVFVAIFLFDGDTPFPSLYALVPTLGSIMIILFSGRTLSDESPTFVRQLLSARIMVGIGLLSYSAYLWHQPLFAFARHRTAEAVGPEQYLALSALALALAYLSWKYVEAPFRDRKRVSAKDLVAIFAPLFTVTMLGALALNIGYDRYRGFWLAAQSPKFQTTFALIEGSGKGDGYGFTGGVQDDGACRFNANSMDDAIVARIRECAATYGSGTLILGDSHAIDLYGMVLSRFPDVPFLVGLAQASCRPHDAGPECNYDALLRTVTESPDLFSHIIFEQAGFYLLEQKDGEQVGRGTFSHVPLGNPAPDLGIDRDQIRTIAEYLAQLNAIVPVTWFSPRMEPHIPDKVILLYGCDHDFALRAGQPELYAALDDEIEDQATSHELGVLSQNEVMAFDYPADFMTCETSFWADGDHYSREGEITFGRRLPDDFLEMKQPPS